MSGPQEIFLRKLFKVAVETADPMVRISNVLPDKPTGRLIVVGAGKASARMAEAVEKAWGMCDGLVITRYGYARPCHGIEIVEAAHPVPDENGLAATKRIVAKLNELGEGDFVLSLISGGGSALLISPAGSITLSEKQYINESLLISGAPISQMNIVRKHLSDVKGGQLASVAYPANMLSLIISDVPGDAPGAIASGPTVGDDSLPKDALEILRKLDIDIPETVLFHLLGKPGVVKPNDVRLTRSSNLIIAAPKLSLEAAAELASAKGIEVRNLGDALEGEARDMGRKHANIALSIQNDMSPGDADILLLSGGECTVTRRGAGTGGPNAEFALSAAIALSGSSNIYAISCDTDGVDGSAEVAGAYVDSSTTNRASDKGLDPEGFLNRNDSHSFFEAICDQVITGPTLTNVNDFRAFFIQQPQKV